METHIDFKISRIVENSAGIEVYARVYSGIYEDVDDGEGNIVNRYARKKLLWEGTRSFPAGTARQDIRGVLHDRLQALKGELKIIPEQAVRDAVR